MTTSKSPAPPALADDAGARTRGPNWPGFRSLSRAMFRGFVRDRAALFFTILFTVLFLLLFGSIYKSSSTPKINVVEVGRVSVLEQARAGSHGQLDKVLTVTHTTSLSHALNEVRQANVDAFVNDPDVAIAVCSLTAAGVGLNLQVASNIVLSELSWTDAEQTQAIDRSHRIGQSEPVTAWRIIAAQTIDTRIAELIDSKAGLAARALDGSDEEVSSSADVQLEALAALLTDALRESTAVATPTR